MSKILRENAVGVALSETLKGAKDVRDAIVKRPGRNLSPHDVRRQAARREGFEIGRQEGIEAGRAEAYEASKKEYDAINAAQATKFADGLSRALDSFTKEQAAWYASTEDSLADLAIEIARRAIASELQVSRESVIAIAHEVLAEANEGSRVRLRVNPLDGSAVEARKRELTAAFSNLKGIEVVEDRSIGFGCKLETDAGMIDARVEDFLSRLASAAKEAR